MPAATVNPANDEEYPDLDRMGEQRSFMSSWYCVVATLSKETTMASLSKGEHVCTCSYILCHIGYAAVLGTISGTVFWYVGILWNLYSAVISQTSQRSPREQRILGPCIVTDDRVMT